MDNKFDIKSIEFSAAALPDFSEVINSKDWVYFGDDNFWPFHSIDLYNFSAILRAALNSIKDGIVGSDMLINGVSGNLVMANSTESVYDVFKNVALDYVIHNGFSLNTILRNDREGVSEFYHMDLSKLRAGKCDEYDRVNHYYYSSDWRNPRKYKPVEMEAFRLDGEQPSQVWYYKNYQPDQSYYPVNDWISGRYAAEIDVEIKNYHLNNLQNGYNSGALFSMNNGIPSEEEREAIYRHLEERYTSTNNAGQIIVTYSEDKEHEPTVTPFTNSASADMFLQLNEMVNSTLLTSTRISSPMLLGIKTAGQLGGRTEMLEAYEHFISTVVKPKQETIIREFEKIMFMKTKQPVKIEIVPNKLFEDDLTIETVE